MPLLMLDITMFCHAIPFNRKFSFIYSANSQTKKGLMLSKREYRVFPVFLWLIRLPNTVAIFLPLNVGMVGGTLNVSFEYQGDQLPLAEYENRYY